MVQSLSLSLSLPLSYINVYVIDGYLKQYIIFFLLNFVSVIYRYYGRMQYMLFSKSQCTFEWTRKVERPERGNPKPFMVMTLEYLN